MKNVIILIAAVSLMAAVSHATVVQLFYDDFTGTTLHPRWTVVNGFDSTGAGFIGTDYGTEANGGAMSTASGGYAYASLSAIPSNAQSITVSWAAWEYNNSYWSIVAVDGTHSSPTSWAPVNGAFICARTNSAGIYAGGTGTGATNANYWNVGIKGAWRQYELTLSGKSGVVTISGTVKNAAGTALLTFNHVTSTDFQANYVSIAGSIGNTAWLDNVNVSYVIPEPATVAILGLGSVLLRKRRV